MSGTNLTPGDPLGGGAEAARAPASPPPSGYAGPRPPGAIGGAERLGPPPPVSSSPAGFATTGSQLELAGWWRRAGAQLIDGLIIGIVALVLIVPFGIGAIGADTDGGVVAAAIGILVTGLVWVVVALVYAPLLMARTNGQTLGRMATGIRVVRTSGQPMDFSTAALREVVFKALLIGTIANTFTFGLASLLDVLWPLWDEENRALHDFPVHTRTVLA